MAKSRSALVDYCVFLVVRLIVCVVQALGWRQAMALADLLAWLAYRLDARHRQVARDNLQESFPDLTPVENDRLVRGVYRHFCRLIMELAHVPRKLHPANSRRYVDLESSPELVEALVSGRQRFRTLPSMCPPLNTETNGSRVIDAARFVTLRAHSSALPVMS